MTHLFSHNEQRKPKRFKGNALKHTSLGKYQVLTLNNNNSKYTATTITTQNGFYP
jgi:hypothetical protein